MANHDDLWERRPRCEQHPELRPLPGVCSSCLREKLQHLFIDSDNRFSWSSSLHTSSSSNFSDNGWSSPPPAINKAAARRDHHRRNGSAADAAVFRSVSVGGSIRSGNGGGGLRKSRSVAFVARNRSSAGDQAVTSKKKIKRGFWSKLIHFKSTPRDHHQPADAIY